MRRFVVAMVTLSVSAVFTQASALQANDTMRAWKNSSVKDRSDLLEHLLGKGSGDAEGANVLKCLNATANIPGHTDLEIGDIVKACEAPENAGQPV